MSSVTHFGPDPFGGKGSLLVNQYDKRVWICEVEPGVFATCTETLVDPLLDQNARDLNDSLGKRFGDGVRAASIPLDIYFRELVPAKKQGDDKYIRRWLNDPDHEKFRTFRGKL